MGLTASKEEVDAMLNSDKMNDKIRKEIKEYLDKQREKGAATDFSKAIFISCHKGHVQCTEMLTETAVAMWNTAPVPWFETKYAGAEAVARREKQEKENFELNGQPPIEYLEAVAAVKAKEEATNTGDTYYHAACSGQLKRPSYEIGDACKLVQLLKGKHPELGGVPGWNQVNKKNFTPFTNCLESGFTQAAVYLAQLEGVELQVELARGVTFVAEALEKTVSAKGGEEAAAFGDATSANTGQEEPSANKVIASRKARTETVMTVVEKVLQRDLLHPDHFPTFLFDVLIYNGKFDGVIFLLEVHSQAKQGDDSWKSFVDPTSGDNVYHALCRGNATGASDSSDKAALFSYLKTGLKVPGWNVVNKAGRTPLGELFNCGSSDITAILEKFGEDLDSVLTAEDMRACFDSQQELFPDLYQRFMTANCASGKEEGLAKIKGFHEPSDSKQPTPLMLYVKDNNDEGVRMLLDTESAKPTVLFNVNHQVDPGFTAYGLAYAKYGSKSTVTDIIMKASGATEPPQPGRPASLPQELLG